MTLLDRMVLVSAAVLALAAPAIAQDDRPSITIGVQSLPAGFDPGLNISNVGQRVNYSIFDELIRRAYWEGENGDGSELAPSLAVHWRNVSPNEWEVDIRTDVVFHDGTPMTAEDVAFSFGEERVFGEDRLVAVGPTYFGNFTDVEVVDEDTVRFTTSAPDPIFPYRFTTTMGKVVPKDYYLELGPEQFNLAPIGTGPYKLAEIRQGEFIRLEANDDYWGGLPPVREITFIEIPEMATRISGLMTGELDIITDISPDQKDILAQADGVQLMPALIDNSRVMVFNTFEPPMDDPNLRRALAYAVDRQAVVEALWAGDSQVLPELVFPSHGEEVFASRQAATYDPEEARRLLEASDYNGEQLVLRILNGYYTNYLEVAQVLQQMWRENGINVSIELFDVGGEPSFEGTWHMRAWSNGMQMPDLTHPIVNVYGSTSIRTMPEDFRYVWEPPARFDELLDLLNTTVDPEERLSYFNEALDIVEAEAPQMEMFQNVEYFGVREGINWKPYSFFMMDLGPTNLSFN
ncbi:ABC transporter substrate-binding protein [Pelagibacterium sp. H642]|uniref:ABC transporter substrate-binding protein n=1 Tax=Pelagibacterium sp. H642 TaxID=1881069 RepID=UPI002814C603|nr:ABC transporter substrate-binding protein [Pelagibacterium sp. H642]WMT92728.1 ABC transporter substrate-binding protein [Pelagibacterium sp. H642]